MANVAAPVKGTQPEGTHTEADASRKVREMFAKIAPRYDFLNHFLSFDTDRLWRKRTARLLRPILQRPDANVLDLCCGTGDLSLSLAREGQARIFGADFAHPMLVRAAGKTSSQLTNPSNGAPRILTFLEADALRLPFADQSFDLVTTAFGFRNLANYEAGLREIHRILKPGGTIAILEFTEPPAGLLGAIYRWYFREVLSRLGGLISGNYAAYTYLPKSVSRFFLPPELSSLMQQVGYISVNFCLWTFATVALHTAQRPL
ncbi:MAG: bifunctional demethylmenaquinone methyltransferase/2-methoxy-6-polyprenyl-1,4-benzoquinol methylase UbiE [Candidatus Acidiferrum sp.]